jgi:hypothetical protein
MNDLSPSLTGGIEQFLTIFEGPAIVTIAIIDLEGRPPSSPKNKAPEYTGASCRRENGPRMHYPSVIDTFVVS